MAAADNAAGNDPGDFNVGTVCPKANVEVIDRRKKHNRVSLMVLLGV